MDELLINFKELQQQEEMLDMIYLRKQKENILRNDHFYEKMIMVSFCYVFHEEIKTEKNIQNNLFYGG
jgi:hypothetical protein